MGLARGGICRWQVRASDVVIFGREEHIGDSMRCITGGLTLVF